MDITFAKSLLDDCVELTGLPDNCKAKLFWRTQQLQLQSGDIVYLEDDPLDETFCVVATGELAVMRNGTELGRIGPKSLFGEMAYFTLRRVRTATVQVISEEAELLQMNVTLEELASAEFAKLRKYLGVEAWKRFIENVSCIA